MEETKDGSNATLIKKKENEWETLGRTWEDSKNLNVEDSKQKQENKQNKRPQDRQDNKNYLEQALIPNDADPIAQRLENPSYPFDRRNKVKNKSTFPHDPTPRNG